MSLDTAFVCPPETNESLRNDLPADVVYAPPPALMRVASCVVNVQVTAPESAAPSAALIVVASVAVYDFANGSGVVGVSVTVFVVLS